MAKKKSSNHCACGSRKDNFSRPITSGEWTDRGQTKHASWIAMILRGNMGSPFRQKHRNYLEDVQIMLIDTPGLLTLVEKLKGFFQWLIHDVGCWCWRAHTADQVCDTEALSGLKASVGLINWSAWSRSWSLRYSAVFDLFVVDAVKTSWVSVI